MGHRFTYVVSPEEERENLTVEWFLRRHGYSRHIITGLKRTEDGIFRNGVRAWTSQAVHAGDVIETHLVETEPPTEFCRGRFRFRLCMRMTTSSLWINPLIRRFIRRLEIMKIRWQTALHGILNRKVNPSSTAVSTASTATPPALSCSPSTP